MIFTSWFQIRDPRSPTHKKIITPIKTTRCMILKDRKNNIYQMRRIMMEMVIKMNLIMVMMIIRKVHLKIFIKKSKFNNQIFKNNMIIMKITMIN